MFSKNESASAKETVAEFLAGESFHKGRWRETSTSPEGVELHYHWTGQGRDALEVALASSARRLGAAEVRALWAGRHGRSAAPLLTVILYEEAGQVRALLCGPAGDSPAVVEVDANQAERLAGAALKESNRHQAAALIRTELEQAGEDLAGLNNKGLLATHELVTGVPGRHDWQQAVETGRKLLKYRDHDLIRALGYDMRAAGHHHILRSKGGNARAIAVFLEPTELPDVPSVRLDSNTPVSYALAQADRENLPWVISVKGSKIRLYSTTTSGAVGQRGRAETFIELNLNLLPDDQAGYLPLLLSSSALEKGGSFYEIQDASRTYATGLSERLRERVYGQAVPRLALSIAKEVGGTSKADLAQHYRTALTILFRLLFISYAEDSKLLPLGINGDYTDHSLKGTAIRISEGINAGRELGFDNPFTGASSEKPDEQQFNLWREAQDLFKAVDKGHTAWGVPAYNGGLFSAVKETNPVGHIIETLSLSNADFGPALTALTIDRTPDGTVGPIDFRSLSVREFGTIYEGLLESELSVAEQNLTVAKKDSTYLPAKDTDDVVVREGEVYLHNKSGQRKASGAYFTKPFAVDHLLDKALVPTLKEHLDRVKALLEAGREADAADMLFDFRVADISMGSGHFLTAVVDRIEAQISAFLAEHPIPHVTQELDALRSTAEEALGDYASGIPIENASLLRRLIARRCVYGVDINPISVELARVSMWIHTFVPGLPLSFLNHNLVTGDSLTGIGTIEEAAAVLERHQGPMQAGLFNRPLHDALGAAKEPLARMAKLVDATPKDIAAARAAQAEVLEAIEPVTAFFDTMVAVRLKERDAPVIGSISDLEQLVDDSSRAVAQELNSLHFPIAFPEVFLRSRPGFDVLVGNPPWSEVVADERAFWTRHIPGLKGQKEADAVASVNAIREQRPDLVKQLEDEVAAIERLSGILSTGPFPGFASGTADLYKAFSWRFVQLARDGGAISIVLPRSIFTTKGSEDWRKAALPISSATITTIRNTKEWVFDDVNPGYVVTLVTLANLRQTNGNAGAVTHYGQYDSSEAFIKGLAAGGAQFNVSDLPPSGPLTLPALPSDEASELFAKLLQVPVIGDPDRSDVVIRPHTEFHATADRKSGILKTDGDTLVWNHTNLEHFRFAPENGAFSQCDATVAYEELHQRRKQSASRTGSVFQEVIARHGRSWLEHPDTHPAKHPRIAFRSIIHSTNKRKVWASLLPAETLLTNSAPYLLFAKGDVLEQAFLLAMLNSAACDWYAHLFVSLNLNFFIFNALPIPVAEINDPKVERAARLAITLAINEEGNYGEFRSLVIEERPDREDMLAELDGIASLLYGLDQSDMELVWGDQNSNRPPLDAVTAYRKQWSLM